MAKKEVIVGDIIKAVKEGKSPDAVAASIGITLEDYETLLQNPRLKSMVEQATPDVYKRLAKLPDDADLSDMARSAAQDVFETIFNIMKNAEASDGDRLKAALALGERGFGKPTQGVEVSGELDLTHSVSQDDKAIIERYLNQKGATK